VIFLQLLIRRERAKPGCRGPNVRIALAALCVALAPWPGHAHTSATTSTPFLHGSSGAVASDSEAASQAGLQLLKSGGNAVDAACAAALALGVVHPFASGLGGGGFAMVYLARSDKAVALDFRETAPRGLRARADGGPAIPPQSGLSIGVPGEAAGLAELVRRFGALPFSRCVEPALRLARDFPASPWLVRQIKDEIARNPTSALGLIAEVFELNGRAGSEIRAGDRLTRPLLAKTLEALRAGGAEAFYRGESARTIVASAAAAGGVLSLDDLAHYAPVERTPLETKFLGRRVLLMPPPSAGGVIIAQTLGIVSNRIAALKPGGDSLSPEYLHLVAEALKHGFADRSRFLGDPAFARLPLPHLLDPAYHRELSLRIRSDRVLAHDAYGTASPRPAAPARDGGTAHVSVVDKAGNAVALTTTVNLEFGSRIVAGKTGIVLNDEMDDFTEAPDKPDVFSLSGGSANHAAPGKRPVSSMSPTIVLGKRGVELVAGAAGGPRIVSATLQILLDVLLFERNVRQAVEAPRIHHQWEPDILFHEPGLPAEVVRALEKKGQRTQMRPDVGKANAIMRTGSGLDAAADPRSGGASAGY
jgi:gamma-glutamyltranspeptidase/glutathione hydrolase